MSYYIAVHHQYILFYPRNKSGKAGKDDLPELHCSRPERILIVLYMHDK